jgi:hypothetical protein
VCGNSSTFHPLNEGSLTFRSKGFNVLNRALLDHLAPPAAAGEKQLLIGA